jgi:hypothetical protein
LHLCIYMHHRFIAGKGLKLKIKNNASMLSKD